jgi:hypothetical protein
MEIRLRDQLDCRKQEDNESSLNYYNDMQSLIQLLEPAMPSGDVTRLIRRVQFKGAKTLRNARFTTRKYGRIQEPTQKIRRDNNTR